MSLYHQYQSQLSRFYSLFLQGLILIKSIFQSQHFTLSTYKYLAFVLGKKEVAFYFLTHSLYQQNKIHLSCSKI